ASHQSPDRLPDRRAPRRPDLRIHLPGAAHRLRRPRVGAGLCAGAWGDQRLYPPRHPVADAAAQLPDVRLVLGRRQRGALRAGGLAGPWHHGQRPGRAGRCRDQQRPERRHLQHPGRAM
ncbi:MAG: hypothetical protein AVDCRST_MAG33-3267, partial [uncultured Thermomicrobiales bacterium]